MALKKRRPGLVYPVWEDWHYVGSGGSEPAFSNSWANVTGSPKLAFRIRETGIVDIQGTIDSGTDLNVFTLPVDYRPSSFTAVTISAYIAANGRISCLATIATNGIVSVLVDPTGAGTTYPERANFGSAQFNLSPPVVA